MAQTIDTKPMAAKFRFNKSALGDQRTPVELNLPVPSVEGIKQILDMGGKELELLIDCLYKEVRANIAEEVKEDLNFDPAKFDFSKVSWTAIANKERAERTTIDDSTWENFAADYLAVMPGASGKTKDQVTAAVLLFRKKLVPVKTRKDVLEKLQEQLALYVETSQNAEEFSDILELLSNRLNSYIKSDDVESMIAALG